MISEPEFWVGVSFLIFVGILDLHGHSRHGDEGAG